MKLHLIQHGEAQSKQQHSDRPLSEQGKTDIEQLANALKGRINVSRIMHSGKTRARQTAQIIHDIVAPQQLVEAIDGINPNDPVEPFIKRLLYSDEECLIVGHLPFLSKMAGSLVCENEDTALIEFTPGTLVTIESTDAGSWQLSWVVRPDLISN